MGVGESQTGPSTADVCNCWVNVRGYGRRRCDYALSLVNKLISVFLLA